MQYQDHNNQGPRFFDYVFGTFIGPSHPNNKGPSILIFFLPYLDSKLTWPYQLSNKGEIMLLLRKLPAVKLYFGQNLMQK